MVKELSPDTANKPLHIGILPRALWGNEDLFDPLIPYPLAEVSPVDAITVPQEIPWCLVLREGFDDLLCGPLRGGVLRDVEMYETSALMGQDEQNEQHCVGHRRHDKELQGHLN